jgi:hypothetical protein
MTASTVDNRPPIAPVAKAISEPHSRRRLKRVADHVDATSYLEIGVFNGKTFNNVSFPRQVGVDPYFGFNVDEYARPGVEFVRKTSDEFFTTRDRSTLFDLVFLDGLHTFKQTLRDFCNSLTCAHPRTVWLIDDVLPSDVYSSLPVAAEARGFRKKAGIISNAWHGDVYKLLFMIHDFFPTLSFVTFSTGGNPQALVWQTPRHPFTPALGSIEAIDRLDYFDLMRRQSFLNLMPEAAALEFFFSSMPGRFTPPAIPSSTQPAEAR